MRRPVGCRGLPSFRPRLRRGRQPGCGVAAFPPGPCLSKSSEAHDQARTNVPILSRLTSLYESRGISIAAGLNPSHFSNLPSAPFTWFVKDGRSLTNGLGIGLQEIYFLECLFDGFHPRRIFVVGNSLGWSTLALALLNPDRKGGRDRRRLRQGLARWDRLHQSGRDGRGIVGDCRQGCLSRRCCRDRPRGWARAGRLCADRRVSLACASRNRFRCNQARSCA